MLLLEFGRLGREVTKYLYESRLLTCVIKLLCKFLLINDDLTAGVFS